jgi:hypothetical protein
MDVERLRAEPPGLAAGRQTLVEEPTRLARPEVELTISEHADLYRVISPESGSPFPGPWRTDRVPYLREPMDCLHPDHPARRITLKASALCCYPSKLNARVRFPSPAPIEFSLFCWIASA